MELVDSLDAMVSGAIPDEVVKAEIERPPGNWLIRSGIRSMKRAVAPPHNYYAYISVFSIKFMDCAW